MNARALMTNLAWSALNVPSERQFRRALRNVRAAQSALLQRMLHENADTEIGRRFGFADIDSPESYRRRVPLSTHEDYEPYLDRIAAGFPAVLTQAPVRLFELSGGSTGAAKRIPYTSALQSQLRRAVAPWMFDLVGNDPRLLAGPSYWAISPAMRTPQDPSSRVPVGFDDDSAYLGGVFKHLVDATLAVPSHVSRMRDLDTFRHITLLYLLRAADLRLVSVWHPTFLELLWEFLVDRWEPLLTDLACGVHHRDPDIRVKADPARARTLGRLGTPTPQAVWPHLRLISCWGDGHARMALRSLQRRFPHCTIQPKGLIATEGIISIPYAGRWPLAVRSHFLEFLETDGTPRFAWELEPGAHYSVVLTTAGGLYRYRLHDLVEVTAFLHNTPCVRFLHKEDHVSDLYGEKLSDGFVAGVVRDLLHRWHTNTPFALLAPRRVPEARDRYVLYIELDDTAELSSPDADADLERALRAAPHYAYCVDLGQLEAASVCRVPPGAFQRYARRLQDQGRRLGDVKPQALSALCNWDDALGVDSAAAKTNLTERSAG